MPGPRRASGSKSKRGPTTASRRPTNRPQNGTKSAAGGPNAGKQTAGARTGAGRPAGASRRRRLRALWWEELPTRELLDVKLKDLDLAIEGSTLEDRVDQLHRELEAAGLRYKPYVWLSDGWFTPEGCTGFAVPFFLAHTRLLRIEHKQMFEAEGGKRAWCMQLLRHETGHSLDNAYRLHRKKVWRETFGKYSDPYEMTYVPKPESKHYVQHLGYWYSQSHAAEDWAETFAVWLQPGSKWRSRYEGWSALSKLESVDAMMASIADVTQPVRTRTKQDSLGRDTRTLREYYEEKKSTYAVGEAWVHDASLLQLFPRAAKRNGARQASRGNGKARESAAVFLKHASHDLRSQVSTLTGKTRYVVDQGLHQMISRCRELDLRAPRSTRRGYTGAAVVLTFLTTQMSRGRGPRLHR